MKKFYGVSKLGEQEIKMIIKEATKDLLKFGTKNFGTQKVEIFKGELAKK